jgi:serine/threonine-protein kinase
MLLGTAAYMSPEQAKGKAADKRSDLWAFGCVFYEMLSGRRAFDGEDVSDTLAAVLRGEPDWAALPPGTPPAIQRLLRRCLEKDRHRRVGDIAAALVLIEEASAPKGEAARVDPAVRSRDRLRPALLAIATLILGGVVAGTGAWLMMRRPTLTPPIRRFTLTFPQPATFTPTPLGRDIAISPDGTAVVYVTTNARQLFLRRLDRLDVTPLAIDGGRTPFFSPDGRWVGYFVLDGLYKVSIDGGLPTRLTGSVGAPRGATWTPDNTIVFATSDPGMGLLQVSADGGEPKALTTPDPSVNELDHLWPQILPGRAAVLFTIQPRGPLEGAQVSVLDLGTGQRKVVLAGTDARYVSPGWLVYGAAGKLQAVRFSVTDLAVSGAPVPVLDQVLTTPDGGMNLTTSGDGTLVYAAGTGRGDPRRLVWVDRQGRETPLDIEPQPFNGPRLSRDGKRLAAWVDDPSNADVVVLDQRQTLRRLTFDRARDSRSMWTPDDKWILFRSDHETDGPGIYRKASDGIGAAERIVPVIGDGGPHSVTRDGLTLIYTSTGTSTLRDIWMVSLDGDRTPRPLIVEPANQNNPTISPDGRWIAYDEEGYVIVRPFPKVAAGRWQVASSGSRWPVWSWNGRELFYVVGRALMSIPVESTAETFQWTAGSKVFEGSYSGLQGLPFLPRNYDVSPDGQRFLMIKESETGASATVIIVENWREELKRLVPTN